MSGEGFVVLVDAKIAATAAKVTPRRIRQRVAEGKLTNHGTDDRILVDLWAILDPQA